MTTKQSDDEFRSGSTDPEFDVWWERFGEPLNLGPKMAPYYLAFAAWAAATHRAEDSFKALVGRMKEMLRESKREHGYQDEGNPCDKTNYLDGEHPCSCGADDWNQRVDALIAGIP